MLWALLWLFTGALLLLVIVRSETFQDWAIDKTTSYLSKELNTKVSVGGFRLQGLTQLTVDSMYVEDRHKDTLFYINELTVNLDRLYFNFTDEEQKVRVRSATLNGAKINFAKYSDTGEWNYKFFFDYFDKKDTTDTTKGPPFNLRIRNLQLQNTSFAMHTAGADTLPGNKFNPSDFRFNNINALFNRFSLVDDSLSFTSENFSTTEKHGFTIKNFTADTRIYSAGMEFYNLLIETEKSRLGNELKMNYTSWDDMEEFISTVVFDAKIIKSEISMDDVAFWGPGMEDLHQVARLNGNIRGTIDNLKGREMFIEAGDESYLAGDFTIKGLPEFDASYIDVKFEKIHTYYKDVEELFGIDDLPEEIKRLGGIDFKGKFTGFPKSFVAYGNFTTALGKIYSDIKMDFSKGNQYATYSGLLKTDGFDLGKFTGSEPTLGKITLDANVKGKGLTEETLDVEVKGKINAIYLNNYTYKNIDVDGLFAGKEFNGYVKVRDENLDLDFDGGVDLTTDTPAMNFVAHVRKANLLALGFDTVPSAVSGRMYINFTGSKIDNLNGDISLGRVVYARNARLVKLDTASLEAGYAGNERFIRLNSDIVSGSITGHYNFSKLSGALYNYAATLLPKIVKADSVVQVREDFNFNINFKKPYVITNLLMEDISVDPFEASGSINTEKQEISLNLSANSFTYRNLHFTGIALKTLPVENGVQRLELSLRDFTVGDSSYLRNSSVTLAFDSTNVLFNINIPESITRLSASLKGQLLLSDEAYTLALKNSTITSSINTWNISDEGTVSYRRADGKYIFEKFKIVNTNETLEVNGIYGNAFYDSIRIEFDSFRLANINYFTRPPDTQKLGGTLDGNITLFNLANIPLFTSSLVADTLTIGTDTLGRLDLLAQINEQHRYIMVDGRFVNGKLENSKIDGSVNLSQNASNNFDLAFIFNNATMKIIEPFLSGIASDFSGKFSTNILLKGTFDKPQFSGSASLDSVYFTIDYLQTKYFVKKTEILFEKDRFTIKPFNLEDERGSTARASGYISHKNFNNFAIDFRVSEMRGFMVLNTTELDNNLYYGTAYMTGSFDLEGPFDDLLFTVKGKSEKGSTLNLKFGDDSGLNTYDFITFVNYESRSSWDETVNLKGIRMNLLMDVDPGTEIKIIFDSQLGDIIRATGYGNFRMEINTLGDFKMYGTYTVETGNYLFTALDVFNRPFTISKGSTITWTGDPLGARMKMQAVYTTLTSPQPLVLGLVPESDLHTYAPEVNVMAIVDLSGQLMKPDIKFGLEIPDLAQLRGGSANTSVLLNAIRRIERDQEEMSRQVFSLITIGSLTTPLDNGYIAGSNDYSLPNPGLTAGVNTLGNLLGNQLTNLIAKADPKWRIGIQVGQSGIDARTNVVVRASRTFFKDDRLQVDVSVDPMVQTGIIPNVSANYKIGSSSNQQVRVFSQNNNNPIFNQNVLTFGTGLFLRSEFENLAELKRKIMRIKDSVVLPNDSAPMLKPLPKLPPKNPPVNKTDSNATSYISPVIYRRF